LFTTAIAVMFVIVAVIVNEYVCQRSV